MTSYAELHAHSYFSFLDGVCSPADLVAQAARLDLQALALIDHDGLYGVVQFAEAARVAGLPTVFGAELTLGLTRRQNGIPDPEGEHLVVLARGPAGYTRLSRTIARALLAGSKGRPVLRLADLAAAHDGTWVVLTGCRKGTVPAALRRGGRPAAERTLDELIDCFGRDSVRVELWDHQGPDDSERNDALIALATRRSVSIVATQNAHYASPSGHRLAAVTAAIRARRCLDDMDGWLSASAAAHLRTGAEQARRFRRFPGAVEHAGELGRALAFDLSLIAPRLPPFGDLRGHPDEASLLRQLTEEGGVERYGPRHDERVPGAWKQIDHELEVITALDFPGYFLIVWDIVQFCLRSDILCQGRGSAANSAVCYALGITKADPVALRLLFERFLSPERDGPPDIDVDIESGRREEVIQYVYARHGGREHVAQVANVISYRPRSAIRDAARAFGYPPGSAHAFSKRVEHHGRYSQVAQAGSEQIPAAVLATASQLMRFPRHLGVHSGGMVICDRPVIEVCPVEWATAPGRTVLQWDKDDCAAAGLVKFDLLGLGMLEALHRTIDLVRDFHGVQVDLARLPQEDAVYERLCQADTVGVFQIESRAQMATLPRLKPRTFYDLVVEVALIRPGPIQGGSVHPYLRRRNNEEPVTYLHPALKPVLEKTLGVPVFQEQLMQIAIDVAGFSPGESDQLRKAMGSKRSPERMAAMRERLYTGMAANGVAGEAADQVWNALLGFAAFGFPESHAASFAYLVYSSSWLKLHYPAAFLAGLLNSQPMGFWSPATLVADARRHGVTVLRPEINHSQAGAVLEAVTGSADPAVRLGLSSVRGIGTQVAQRIAAGAPYRDLADFGRRAGLTSAQIESLATAGATASLDGGDRRSTLWAAGSLSQLRASQFDRLDAGVEAPALPRLSRFELLVADLETTSISVGDSPALLFADQLAGQQIATAADLGRVRHGTRVTVAGIVTHRQRPETAGGVTFISLEDATGLINVICTRGVWARFRDAAQTAAAMRIRGTVESRDGVVNLLADKIEPLRVRTAPPARNFH